jgi:hypothetical protein
VEIPLGIGIRLRLFSRARSRGRPATQEIERLPEEPEQVSLLKTPPDINRRTMEIIKATHATLPREFQIAEHERYFRLAGHDDQYIKRKIADSGVQIERQISVRMVEMENDRTMSRDPVEQDWFGHESARLTDLRNRMRTEPRAPKLPPTATNSVT